MSSLCPAPNTARSAGQYRPEVSAGRLGVALALHRVSTQAGGLSCRLTHDPFPAHLTHSGARAAVLAELEALKALVEDAEAVVRSPNF